MAEGNNRISLEEFYEDYARVYRVQGIAENYKSMEG